jgi:histidinol-phosphate aminotransferase
MDEKPLLVEPVPMLEQLPPYLLGRPEKGIDVILDFNESLESPPSLADQTLPWSVNRYPDHAELERAIAEKVGVDAGSLLVTNGADDALERTVRSVCCAGRRAVVTQPSYGMIRRFAILAGAEVHQVPWWQGDLPDEEICATARGASLLAIVSPNNPTGATASREAFARVVERLPETLIILDQAYLDFTDPEFDLTATALDFPNVVIVRTFSKAWGAAGLRVGYAIADPRVRDWLRRVGLPFPLASPSIAAAIGAVERGGPDGDRIDRIRQERSSLIELLESLGAEPLPSEGSFVLARFKRSRWVWDALAAMGIAVRQFSGRAELDGWLRFTLPGDDLVFNQLCDALRTAVRPEAILFDLDGVLADVSKSYREAVLQTAAHFGVELSIADIAHSKAEGDANNDWRLTQRLLRDRGVNVPLEDVTTRFETLYQGAPDRTGLRATETLLIAPSQLKAISQRHPLGVVTGRPRADAERFLEKHYIRDLFSVVVTMEDGPPKPDPTPVRRAVDQLGVRTVWLLGDTPDDMQAARQAGVLPIGVVAPGDDPELATKTLRDAGAATVLSAASAIQEILP